MKKFLLLVMMLVCVASTCFASDGSVLDKESQIVEKFFTASSYKETSADFRDDLKQEFGEDKYNEYIANVTNEIGKFQEKHLLMLEKRDGADRVLYIAGFDKGRVMLISATFAVEKEKPLLVNIGLAAPQPPEQAQEEQK